MVAVRRQPVRADLNTVVLPSSDPQRPQVLQHHIREEEDEMLVEFAEKVDREKLEELSKKFNQSKHSVPTR